jgi:hypothetical protein
MIQFRVDLKEFNKTLRDVIQYSNGFLQGANISRLKFNQELGNYTLDSLYKFIDSKARMSPDSLHHVYEWGRVGNPSARLFEIKVDATTNNIKFFGNFLKSTSVSDSANEPFFDKANVMENKISIVVEPRSSEVLSFQDAGESVFTVGSIFIDSPGGDAVAGSFGRAVEDFFDFYFTNTVLKQSGIMEKLSNPKEFADGFYSGASGGGRSSGLSAGKKYMTVKGAEII